MVHGSRRVAAEVLRACTRVQRANIDYVAAVRTSVALVVVLLVALGIDRLGQGLSLGFGVLFTALGDSVESAGRRLRGMAWMSAWGAGAVLVGGLISDAPATHIVLGFLIAGACGYAAALGPRGGLIGTIVLVLIAVFSGTSIGTGVAVSDAVLFLAGGIATMAINLSMVPLRRLGTARRSIARAYREFDAATARTGLELAAPVVGTEILTAHAVIEHDGVRGETGSWLNGLLGDIERARFALLALYAERDRAPEYVAAVIRASGPVARAVSRRLVGWGRPDAGAPLAALEAGVELAPSPELRALCDDLAAPLRHAVARSRRPWPVGRRADMSPPPIVGTPFLPRLASHWRWGDPVLEHAIRLSIAFGVATAVAVASGLPHAYWLPMTVAWITKPDLGGTVTRVAMRVIGTLIGIACTAIIIGAMDLWQADDVRIDMVAVGVATFFIVAYIWANYPIAVIGITAFVILIDVLAGADSRDEVISRVIFTVLGGVWVLFVSLARPRRTGATAVDAIAALASAIRAYAAAVRQGADTRLARAEVLRTRTVAMAVVSAAATEPRGLWERPGPRIDPEDAAVLLTDGLDAASAILAEELLRASGQDDARLWARVTAALDDMDERIAAAATER